MQITVVGDEIRIDGSTVGMIQGGPRKEREAFRAALRDAPDVIYEGGSGSFDGEDLQALLDRANDEIAALHDDVSRIECFIKNAIDELKNHQPAEALKILAKALN